MKIQIMGEQSVTGNEGLKTERPLEYLQVRKESTATRHFHTDIADHKSCVLTL